MSEFSFILLAMYSIIWDHVIGFWLHAMIRVYTEQLTHTIVLYRLHLQIMRKRNSAYNIFIHDLIWLGFNNKKSVSHQINRNF